MAELPRYARSEAAQAVPTSKAAADYGFSLAERLRSFANTQHTRLDQQAELEGKQAGLLAASGKTGGIDLSDNSTIRSRAFNQGAQIAHGAAIKIDINETISKLKLENEYDLAAFTTKAAAYKKGLLSEVDPAMWAMAEADIDASISAGTIEIGKAIHKKDEQEIIGQINRGILVAEELALQMAGAGNIDGVGDQMAQIQYSLQQGVNAGLVTEEYLTNYMSKLSEMTDKELAFGTLKRILEVDGIEAAEEAIAAFEKNSSDFAEVDIKPETVRSIISGMQTEINRVRSAENRKEQAMKADLAEKEKELAYDVHWAIKALEQGKFPDNLDELKLKVIGTKYEANLEDAFLHASQLEVFGTQSLEVMKTQIDELDSQRNLSGKDAILLASYKSIYSKQQSLADAEAKAQTDLITSHVKAEAKDAIYSLQHNQIPNGITELIQRAKDNGNHDIAYDLEVELEITNSLINKKIEIDGVETDVSFMHQRTKIMEAIIGDMEKEEDLSAPQVQLLERYKTVLTETQAGIKKDILSLAVEQGRITEIEPINYADPETIANRMDQLRLVQALYGTTEGSPLTDVESNNLIKTLNDEETTIMEKAQLLQTLVEGFGDDAQGIMKQMFDKDAPEYVLVGELLIEGHVGLPADILEGMDLIEKGLVNVPAGLDKEIRIRLGDAAQENPPYAQMVIEAARALYVRKNKGLTDETAGELSGEVENKIDLILDQITGGVLEINGVNIIAPKRGINEDMFEDRLEDLQPNDLNAMGGVYIDAYKKNYFDLPSETMTDVIELVQDATFISIGKGIYHVVISEPGDPKEFLLNKHGEKFVFKYDAKEGLPSTWAEGVTDKDIIPYAKLDREAEVKQEAEKQKWEEGKQQKREEEAQAQIKASEEAFEEGDLGNEYVDELIETITLNEKNTYLSTMERK